MRTLDSRSLARWITAALVGVAACTSPEPADEEVPTNNPNAGMLRDFLDGKFDSAGHPLNARVTEAEILCASAGVPHNGAIRLTSSPCVGQLGGSEQQGDMVASLRMRVQSSAATGTIVSASILGVDGEILASQSLTTSQLRSTSWIDLPLAWPSTGTPVSVRVVPSAGAVIDLDYIEVFPERFGLVASPGAGVYVDGDRLVFELPRSHRLDHVKLDGVELAPRLGELVTAGKAKKTTTTYRTLIEVSLADLAPDRADIAELELRAGSLAARTQLRRDPTACAYEGDPDGIKLLLTGFQPFPAAASHENVSDIAIHSMDPSRLRGARVMRVTMPVEYDRAASQVTDMIARCEPDAVISFGQGGSQIALEQVAYNLQDTGEVAGGVPDNRGIIRAATEIDPAAASTRDTLLPLEQIQDALVAEGEDPQMSRDPGRYICNNVMFANVGAMTQRGGVGGFIHLPYTTSFGAETRARLGRIVEAAVQATADSLR